ncbi:MAG: UDP-N-acetylmuramoyl-L-alanine--D-glutamate ligase [bacterium]|nr:UDP-N-acetylmuramoyl-L-alanine--D-glutamate ligase [bacterium]
MDWKRFFRGKKVTLMGLGLLGRGIGDAVFLAEHGAELIVTDLKPSTALGSSLKKLRKYKNIRYTLGEHKLEDFRNRDFILKAAGVPLDSPYIAEARKNKIPIEMDASLFAKLMPKGVLLVGVTGTRGKSTTTALIYEILSSSPPRLRRGAEGGVVGSVFKAGNLVPEATLPLLKKVKSGDIVVLELDSWQLQGFHDAKISPQVAVFTTFLDDHLSYYRSTSLTASREKYFADKTAIFKYQKKNDVLVVGEQASLFVSSQKKIVARSVDVPKEWESKLLGEHNRENIACAIAAARHFKIPELAIRKAVELFKGISGRLEYLRTVRGIKIYNDTNATTPDATIAALRALGKDIVLICGGTDKGLDMSKLVAEIPNHCKAVVFLKESGTEKLIINFQFPISNQFPIFKKETLKECVEEAMKIAKKGDLILFSPSFASFGKWFKNEYDRGAQFVKIVKCLK